ncbi:MAG TPA: aminopeptidase [Gaiellaceae bacterium]|nr:aminopeptidase [Gaiellaceae bacterium]
MADPRVEAYARLLVEYSLDVQPRMQVLVATTPLARPLYEACVRAIARRGAFAIPRITWGGSVLMEKTWLAAAPEELLGELAPVDRHLGENVDAAIVIEAPENTRADSDLTSERLAKGQAAIRPLLDRVTAHSFPWVLCQYPTPALAQDAGMSAAAFEDVLYDACLIDWAAEGERMRRLAGRLQQARELRIVGPGTDLTLALEGRGVRASEGRFNMPDGEVFFPPHEESADGEVHFSEFPAVFEGRELSGIRLRFRDGAVVDASAGSGEEFLHEVLDRDAGARRLGEVGIGCNPGITRYMRNTLFDEKMDGTVHLALGQSYTDLGGLNESTIHWDLVKDLRHGGRLELDGKVVQQDGAWLS